MSSSLRSHLEAIYMRAQPRSYRLTFDDAVQVWLRHWEGEFQHRTAAAFDVNSARVNDVLQERTHVGSKLVAQLMRKH